MTKICFLPGARLPWQLVAADGVYISGHKTEAEAVAAQQRHENKEPAR